MSNIFKLTLLKSKMARFALMGLLLSVVSQPVWAAGPPEPSVFSNPFAVTLLSLMVILLIVIGILANILLGTADWKRKKKSVNLVAARTAAMIVTLLVLSIGASAQDTGTSNAAVSQTASTIGGLSPMAFYTMASVIFLQLFIIIVLLLNIKFLIRKEREKEMVGELSVVEKKKPSFTWWSRFNKFKPVEQEADIDLGHNYDGIRELDNRLPPWWLWGFYITIVFAAVYLYRYHVSGSAPLSKQEYEESVARADLKIKEYLKEKGESVDENTATYLADAADLAAGQKIFQSSCVACHKEKGEGNVGPNLTDDYWIHGGNIKSIFKTIKYGVDGKGMASWQSVYSAKEIAQVSSFVKSLHGTNPPNAKAPQGELYKEDAPAQGPATDSTSNTTDKKVAVTQ